MVLRLAAPRWAGVVAAIALGVGTPALAADPPPTQLTQLTPQEPATASLGSGTPGAPIGTDGAGATGDAQADRLRVRITPYLWCAGVDATITAHDIPFNMNVDFGDLLRDLEFGAMVHVEAQYNRFFIFGDFDYVKVSQSANPGIPLLTKEDVLRFISAVPISHPQLGSDRLEQKLIEFKGDLEKVKPFLPEVRDVIRKILANLTPQQREDLARLAQERISDARGRLNAERQDVRNTMLAVFNAIRSVQPGPTVDSVDVSMQMTLAEFGGGITLLECDLGELFNAAAAADGHFYPRFRGDVIGGLRYYNIEINQSYTFTPDVLGIFPTFAQVNQRTEWVDGIVGGRLGLDLTPELSIWARGDVGGFQCNTDLSWNVIGGIEWKLAHWFALDAGYRCLHIEHRNGSGPSTSGVDGNMLGPFLGATISF